MNERCKNLRCNDGKVPVEEGAGLADCPECAKPRTVTMTEDEFEAELNFTHLTGIESGLERAGKMLVEAAKNYFAAEKDDQAQLLRKLSTTMYDQAKLQRILADKEKKKCRN